jgi:hypothetical protein
MPDDRTYVLPVPPAAALYGKSPLQERLRRLYAGLLTLSRGSGPLLFPWLEKVNSLTAKLREVATLCVSMVIPV